MNSCDKVLYDCMADVFLVNVLADIPETVSKVSECLLFNLPFIWCFTINLLGYPTVFQMHRVMDQGACVNIQ